MHTSGFVWQWKVEGVASFIDPEESHLTALFLKGNSISTAVQDDHQRGLEWARFECDRKSRSGEVAEYDFEKAYQLLRLSREEKGGSAYVKCGTESVRIRALSVLFGAYLASEGLMFPLRGKWLDDRGGKVSITLNLLKFKQNSAGAGAEASLGVECLS